MTYPAHICAACGLKHGRRAAGQALWRMGKCGLCGRREWLTEPRDFGGLRETWKDERE